MILLNTLKKPDVIFFITCIAIVLVIVAVWFLIPVFNKRQYKDQRDALRKREAAFRSTIQSIKEQNEQVTTDNASVAVSNANISTEEQEEVNKEE